MIISRGSLFPRQLHGSRNFKRQIFLCSWAIWKDNNGAGFLQNAGQPWNTMRFRGNSMMTFFRRGFLGQASDDGSLKHSKSANRKMWTHLIPASLVQVKRSVFKQDRCSLLWWLWQWQKNACKMMTKVLRPSYSHVCGHLHAQHLHTW